MMHNPFRYFNSSPEVIRLAVMMYVRYPVGLEFLIRPPLATEPGPGSEMPTVCC